MVKSDADSPLAAIKRGMYVISNQLTDRFPKILRRSVPGTAKISPKNCPYKRGSVLSVMRGKSIGRFPVWHSLVFPHRAAGRPEKSPAAVLRAGRETVQSAQAFHRPVSYASRRSLLRATGGLTW